MAADTPPGGADAKEKAESERKVIEQQKPGPEHARLATMVGDFEAAYEYPLSPDGERIGVGTIHGELVYGGRFVESHFAEDYRGRHTTGQNLLAFDNVKKKYIGSWATSDSTAIQSAEGTADSTGNVITYPLDQKNPDTGKTDRVEFVVSLTDADHFRFEVYYTPEGGDRLKVSIITYTREGGK